MVESGDTGGKSPYGLRAEIVFRKPPALRSAPSWDRQNAGVYTGFTRQRKGRRQSRPFEMQRRPTTTTM